MRSTGHLSVGVGARLLVAGLLSCAALLLLTGTAQAGQWVQVSCQNPDGSSAPSQNWAGTTSGTPEAGSEANTSCAAGLPMEAFLPNTAAAPIGSGETLTYTPPVGSTLAGGSMQVKLSADGYGSHSTPTSSGAALVMTPGEDTSTDEVETCAEWSDGCWGGEGVGSGGPSDFTGPLTLPVNKGGTLNVLAACLAESGAPNCDADGTNGVWAGAWVYSADTLLNAGTSPLGSGFSGSLLTPNTSGNAQLNFTASESQGPGIYNVTVAIDNNQVYSATPNTNNGECVPVGDWQGNTSILEFDDAQPCPLSDAISVPVTTSAFGDGQHQLTVTITDAANNVVTAYNNTITIDNPIASPLPKVRKGVSQVRVQFIAHAHYKGAVTRLLTLSEKGLPRGGRVAIAIRGPHAPHPKLTSAGRDGSAKLLKELTEMTFRAGDTLTFTVSAPRKRAERVQVSFRDKRVPTVRLL